MFIAYFNYIYCDLDPKSNSSQPIDLIVVY